MVNSAPVVYLTSAPTVVFNDLLLLNFSTLYVETFQQSIIINVQDVSTHAFKSHDTCPRESLSVRLRNTGFLRWRENGSTKVSMVCFSPVRSGLQLTFRASCKTNWGKSRSSYHFVNDFDNLTFNFNTNTTFFRFIVNYVIYSFYIYLIFLPF